MFRLNVFVVNAEPVQHLLVRLKDHLPHLLHGVDLLDLVVNKLSEGFEEVSFTSRFKHVLVDEVAKRVSG